MQSYCGVGTLTFHSVFAVLFPRLRLPVPLLTLGLFSPAEVSRSPSSLFLPSTAGFVSLLVGFRW